MYGLKRQSIIGLPIVDKKSSIKIGSVLDLLYKPGSKRVEGILVTGKGKYPRNYFIPIDDVITIGDYAIIVSQPEYLTYTNELLNSRIKGTAIGEMLGLRVLCDDGQELGTVTDIVLNPLNHEIEGYEVSKGFIDDLVDGRCLLPYYPDHPINVDVIIVSVEQAEQVISYSKGLKGIFYRKIE